MGRLSVHAEVAMAWLEAHGGIMDATAKSKALKFFPAKENIEEVAIFNLLAEKSKHSFVRRKFKPRRSRSDCSLRESRKNPLSKSITVEEQNESKVSAGRSPRQASHSPDRTVKEELAIDTENELAARESSRKAARKMIIHVKNLRARIHRTNQDREPDSELDSMADNNSSVLYQTVTADRTPSMAWHKRKAEDEMELSSSEDDDDLYRSSPVKFRPINDELDDQEDADDKIFYRQL